MRASGTIKKLACLALMTAAGALALRWWSWSPWTALVIAVLLATAWKVLYAAQEFGEIYTRYAARTPAFFPRLGTMQAMP